eukprot:TRINITY_DN17593_c0_g1_i2.p1 TRINITY_DN17593_c0_g1~~TRINITY_DN17593_c0_g1_i2.p1  ORF type:complete len:476 (+),score=74.81 TRINITY_DN17593_c0_g1_i2:93-1520(+)
MKRPASELEATAAALEEPTGSITLSISLVNGQQLTVVSTRDEKLSEVGLKLLRAVCEDAANFSVRLCHGGDVLRGDELVDSLDTPELQAVVTKVPTIGLIGPDLEGSGKYRSTGVLDEASGCLYFAPCDADYVLCVNTQTQRATTIGTKLVGTDKFEAGGVAAPNRCIYFAPLDAAQVLKVDPAGGTVGYIGDVLERRGASGENKYMGTGVLADNNCIYFAPNWPWKVLRIDTTSDKVRTIGKSFGRNAYCTGGLKARDGRIFFAPFAARCVLCIDPKTDTVKTLGHNLPRFAAGGVCGSDGRLFFVSSNRASLMIVDPSSDAIDMVDLGPLKLSKMNMHIDGTVTADGKAYWLASSAADSPKSLLVVDTSTAAVATIDAAPFSGVNSAQVPEAAPLYLGAGVPLDSFIFYAPAGEARVLSIDTSASSVALAGPELGPDVSERDDSLYECGGLLGADGAIYFAPFSATRVLRIEP